MTGVMMSRGVISAGRGGDPCLCPLLKSRCDDSPPLLKPPKHGAGIKTERLLATIAEG